MPHQWSWQVLRAGSFRLDGGGMFGVVPRPLWSKMVQPDEQNRIPLQTNCLLLDDGELKVLIETGFGNKWTDKERGFYDLEKRTVADALREKEVDPSDISHVIVTHLHFDHAAGLTTFDSNNNPIPTFPNAIIHVQRREWEDALTNKSTMTRTYLRSHLDPISERTNLVKGEKEILPGISVLPVPGHTWGQHAVRFYDKDGIVCFPGDVMPTISHVGLAYNMGFDMEPFTNMLTKAALLERAANEGWRLALDHEPGNPVVRVNHDPDRAKRFSLSVI